MKTIFAMVFFSVFLFGCDASHKNISEDFRLPEELKDCKVYRLRGENHSNTLVVVACPNKETTTYQDKRPTVTILQ